MTSEFLKPPRFCSVSEWFWDKRTYCGSYEIEILNTKHEVYAYLYKLQENILKSDSDKTDIKKRKVGWIIGQFAVELVECLKSTDEVFIDYKIFDRYYMENQIEFRAHFSLVTKELVTFWNSPKKIKKLGLCRLDTMRKLLRLSIQINHPKELVLTHCNKLLVDNYSKELLASRQLIEQILINWPIVLIPIILEYANDGMSFSWID